MRIMPSASALVMLLCAPAVAWASQSLSVADVKSKLQSLDGKTIQIRGWVVGCNGGFDCRLVTSLSDQRSPSLTIDFVASFEPRLTAVAGDEIILRAKVTDECTVNICLDRGPDIIPIRVMKVF